MIQTQTELLIKDNSGMLKARCIDTRGKRFKGIGGHITTAILKAKAVTKQKTLRRNKIQELLIIQTKKPIRRDDGSTVTFSNNSGVCVTSGSKVQLGFKRINTTVAIELKKYSSIKKAKGSFNLIKLAKNLV